MGMRRRAFLGAQAGVTVAWPLAAQPGESKKRIGVLISRPEKDPEGQSYAKLAWFYLSAAPIQGPEFDECGKLLDPTSYIWDS